MATTQAVWNYGFDCSVDKKFEEGSPEFHTEVNSFKASNQTAVFLDGWKAGRSFLALRDDVPIEESIPSGIPGLASPKDMIDALIEAFRSTKPIQCGNNEYATTSFEQRTYQWESDINRVAERLKMFRFTGYDADEFRMACYEKSD